MPITLRIPPQISEDDAKELIAEALGNLLHEREADAQGATFDNYAWSVDAVTPAIYRIASKTDKGILRTEINVETGAIAHHWHTGDDE